jgi:hypothetical protein
MAGLLRLLYDALNHSIIAWGALPLIVVLGLMMARIRSRPRSPTVLTMLRRPFTVMFRQPFEDLAIGLDVLFAAIALQFGFMAEMASDAETLKKDNVFFEDVLGRHFPQGYVSVIVLVVLLTTSCLLTLYIRERGHNVDETGKSAGLREYEGVTAPIYVGIGCLWLVYLCNPL